MDTPSLPEEEQEILYQLSVIDHWASVLVPSVSLEHFVNNDPVYSLWLIQTYSECAGELLSTIGDGSYFHQGKLNTVSVKDYFRHEKIPYPIDRFLKNLKQLVCRHTLNTFELRDVRVIIETLISFLIMEREHQDE